MDIAHALGVLILGLLGLVCLASIVLNWKPKDPPEELHSIRKVSRKRNQK